MRNLSIIVAAIAVIGLSASTARACDRDHASSGHTSAADARTADAKMASGCCMKGASATTASTGASCGARSAGAGCGARSAGASCMSGAHACDLASCAASNIEYRVTARDGEVRTFDRDKAFAAAAPANAPVAFYVMDTAYATETAAQTALVASLDRRVQDMLTVQCIVNGQSVTCQETAARMASSGHCTMQYRVASHDFAKKAEAEAYLAKIHAAVQAVRVVDSDGHPVSGCASAQSAQCKAKKMTYKVGDQVTADPASAEVLRAREQLRVILASQA